MALPDPWRRRLRLPLVVAPMTTVSTPALARAACERGAIGSFPAHNAQSADELGAWIDHATVEGGAPLAVNLVVHRSNPRLAADLDVVAGRGVELVITSVGAPGAVVEAMHAVGGRVVADVATIHHARRAVDAGVDGLVLLAGGGGGQSGSLNPFAFVRAVRAFYDGIVVLAGGVADGVAVRAAELLGADLAFMGTRFVACHESGAAAGYKAAVVAGTADDVVLTDRYTGLPTNLLRAWIEHDAGAEPVERGGGFDQQRLLSRRDAWSAGHGVGACRSASTASEVLLAVEQEYRSAVLPA